MNTQGKNKKKIRVISVIIIGVLIFVGILAFFWQKNSKAFEEYLDTGHKYLNELDYENAIIAFEKAIQIEPKNKTAYVGVANAYEALGEYDKAKAVYLNMADEFPGDGEAYTLMAELHIRLQELEKARQLLEEAVLQKNIADEQVKDLYQKTMPKAPIFSLEAGTYTARQIIEIISPEGDQIIYYTLDGSEPTQESEIYTEPIILPNGITVIKAKGVNNIGYESEIVEKTYELAMNREILVFEDRYLENFVRDTLNVWGPLYDDQVAQITSLTAVGPYSVESSQGSMNIFFEEQGYLMHSNHSSNATEGMVTTLVDLQYMPFLQELEIAYQESLDLTGIEKCTNLKRLSLIKNNLKDITQLSNLTSLEKLSLGWNRISDLTPVSNMNQLTSLAVWSNQISDLSPIAGLTQLRVLDFSDNEVSDLSPLMGLSELRTLWMYENKVSDIAAITSLHNLDTLMFIRNPITDYSPFHALFPKLSRTDVSLKAQGGEN